MNNVQFIGCETSMQREAAWIAADRAQGRNTKRFVEEVCGFMFRVRKCKSVTKIILEA